jgi:hypothetical protein
LPTFSDPNSKFGVATAFANRNRFGRLGFAIGSEYLGNGRNVGGRMLKDDAVLESGLHRLCGHWKQRSSYFEVHGSVKISQQGSMDIWRGKTSYLLRKSEPTMMVPDHVDTEIQSDWVLRAFWLSQATGQAWITIQ